MDYYENVKNKTYIYKTVISTLKYRISKKLIKLFVSVKT